MLVSADDSAFVLNVLMRTKDIIVTPHRPHWILAVEDSDTDAYLFQHVLDECRNDKQIIRSPDGEKAIAFLRELADSGETSLPDFVVIDLNLPRVNGYEVLAHLRSEKVFQSVPVIVITSSQTEEDRRKAMAGGADAYFVKPLDLASYYKLPDVMEGARQVRMTRLGQDFRHRS